MSPFKFYFPSPSRSPSFFFFFSLHILPCVFKLYSHEGPVSFNSLVAFSHAVSESVNAAICGIAPKPKLALKAVQQEVTTYLCLTCIQFNLLGA